MIVYHALEFLFLRNSNCTIQINATYCKDQMKEAILKVALFMITHKTNVMKRSLLLACISLIFFSCKKNIEPAENQLTDLSIGPTVSPDHPSPAVNYLFSFQATGPFTISPVSATVVKIEQELSFSSVSPFALTGGIVQGFDDLTIPTFPDRFFNGSFRFFGQGNDSLFATVTVQTSVFSDPIDPGSGDFFGSEDFTGTYQITGGTGHYLNATGSGEYAAHSEWRPPVKAGTLFSGFTAVAGLGTISVLARNGRL